MTLSQLAAIHQALSDLDQRNTRLSDVLMCFTVLARKAYLTRAEKQHLDDLRATAHESLDGFLDAVASGYALREILD